MRCYGAGNGNSHLGSTHTRTRTRTRTRTHARTNTHTHTRARNPQAKFCFFPKGTRTLGVRNPPHVALVVLEEIAKSFALRFLILRRRDVHLKLKLDVRVLGWPRWLPRVCNLGGVKTRVPASWCSLVFTSVLATRRPLKSFFNGANIAIL